MDARGWVLRSVAVVVFAVWLRPAGAAACEPLPGAPFSALPKPRATEVSPLTSIIVIGGDDRAHRTYRLSKANGSSVVAELEQFATGATPRGWATFWRITTPLDPSTAYSLEMMEADAVRGLTDFTTAASYDKAPGVPPKLDRLRLLRVRYPVSRVAAGDCVFDEFEASVDFEYQPGLLPGTPDDELVYVLALSAMHGGGVQRFAFSGFDKFNTTNGVDAASPNAIQGLDQRLPSPAEGWWRPTLEPDREYCLTLSVIGRNDIAIGETVSAPLCAPVTNIDARTDPPTIVGGGAPPGAAGSAPIPQAGAGGADVQGSGLQAGAGVGVVGAASQAGAGAQGAASQAGAGAQGGSSRMSATADMPCPVRSSPEGCATSMPGTIRPSWLAAVALLLCARVRRGRAVTRGPSL